MTSLNPYVWLARMVLLFGLVSALLLPQSVAASDIPLHERLARDGLVVVDYAGSDAGRGGTGLRLTSMGRFFDAANQPIATVWRLRNANPAARRIRLDAAGTAFERNFNLPAHSETFYASVIAGGAATHRLYFDGGLVDTKAAGNQTFGDERLVDDPWADAGQCGALGAATAYNGWFVGDYSAQSSDVQGRLAAGGTITLNHYSIADQLPAPDHASTLVAGADIHFPSGRVYVGDILAGGDANLGAPVVNGLTSDQAVVSQAALPFSFAAEQQQQIDLSQRLSLVSANGTVDPRWGGLYLTGDGSSEIQVFALDGQAVWDAHTFDVQGIPSHATVIFNVSGQQAGLTNMSLQSLVAHRQRVLFNFFEATELTLAGIGVEGSILAPMADIDNPQGVVIGQVIAQSWNGMMQLNEAPFTGCLPPRSVGDNRAPIAGDLAVDVDEDASAAITLTASDDDGDPLSFAVVDTPTHGMLIGTPPNVSYVPNADFNGSDAFTFIANDGELDSNVATIIITVSPINDAPVALDDVIGINEDTVVSINLQANDADGDDLVFAITTAPIHGTLTGTAPNLTYTPNGDFNGSDQLTFVASDGEADSNSAMVAITINAINDAPQSNDLSFTTDENTALAITLAGTDADADALSYAVVASPTNGMLSGTAPNLTYTPNDGFNGGDTFTFIANDGELDSNLATVSITVNAVNDAPQANDLAYTVDEDMTVAVTLAGTDPDGDALSYAVGVPPSNGALSGSAPNLSYTPGEDFNGSDSFTYTANDGELDAPPATVTITVNPVNDAPVSEDGVATTAENTTVDMVLVATDVDGDPLTFTVVDAPANGTLSGQAPNLTYTPSTDFDGEDAFTFTASDGTATSDLATVAVTVTHVNRAPVADDQALTIEQDQALAIELTGSDPDGDAITYVIATPPSHGTLAGSAPTLSYTPSPGYTGSDSFQFIGNDGELDSASATVTIQVTEPNLPPEIVTNPPTTVVAGDTYTYDVDAMDPDGDVVSYTLQTSPPAAGIDLDSGEILWQADPSLSRGLLADNPFCAIPADGTSSLIPAADVAVVVDESGSMRQEHAWIREFVPFFGAHLQSIGIGIGAAPNLYGLVGFVDQYFQYPVIHGVEPSESPWLDLEGFIPAAEELHAEGAGEDGWKAMQFTLDNLPYRENVGRNMILLGDNPGRVNNDPITYDEIEASLLASNTILNAVVAARFVCDEDARPAIGVTADGRGFTPDGQGGYEVCPNGRPRVATGAVYRDYILLALATGGAAWDIEILRAGGDLAESFARALIDVKVEEILGQIESQPQADLAFERVERSDTDGVVVSIANRGLIASQTRSVSLSNVNGLIATQTIDPIAAGDRVEINFVEPGLAQQRSALTVELDPSNNDCDLSNDTLTVPQFRVRASDPAGAADEQVFTVTVTEQNSAPRITSTPSSSSFVDFEYGYQLVVDDDNGDDHSFALVSGPDGAVINPLSGLLTFTPTMDQLGSHDFTVTVEDIAGLTDTQSFTVTVSDGYQLPTITSVASRLAAHSTTYIYQPQVLADPSAVLTFDYIVGPDDLLVDPQTGELIWQVPADVLANRIIVLRVRDQFGNYDLELIDLIIDVANDPPLITSTPPTLATVGGDLNVFSRAADINRQEFFTWRVVAGDGLAFSGTAQGLETGLFKWNDAETGLPPALPIDSDPFCGAAPATAALEPMVELALGERGNWSQPLVGPLFDRNADGQFGLEDRAAIVVIANPNYSQGLGSVVAWDAIDGTLLWQRDDLAPDGRIKPAMADIDNDGRTEIVLVDQQDHLVLLAGDGALRWRSVAPIGVNGGTINLTYSALGLVDLDQDGTAEILAGPSVFNADGTERFQFTASANGWERQGYGSAIAFDTNGDGELEVAFADQVRRSDGSLLWRRELVATNGRLFESFLHADDLNGDGQPELIAIDQTTSGNHMSTYAGDGSLLWRQTVSGRGPMSTVDVDQDGDKEILSLVGRELIDGETGNAIWSSFSAATLAGAVVVDLDGDGALEAVYQRGLSLEIIDLRNGLKRLSIASPASSASYSVPSFADVDGDGGVEMYLSGATVAKVVPQFGQWSFAVDLPGQVLTHGNRIGNDMRLQRDLTAAAGQRVYTSSVMASDMRQADLQVSAPYSRDLDPTSDDQQITVTVTNVGAVGYSLGFDIEVYRDAIVSGNLLAQFAHESVLAIGETVSYASQLIDATLLGEHLVARVVPRGGNECRVDNNVASARTFRIRVTDRGGLTDEQPFAIGVQAPNLRPSLTVDAATIVTVGETVEATASISDDVWDRTISYLTDAPIGARYDANTNRIVWTPNDQQVGRHRFVLTAIDLAGLAVNQSWNVDVVAPTTDNQLPTFISPPPSAAALGGELLYRAQALDPDENNPLHYAVVDAPGGLTIDPHFGIVRWTPTTLGTFPVTLSATDTRGGVATQAFTIEVVNNRAPVIVSQPATSAKVARTYRYEVAANDPDGDPLSYRLDTAPVDMTLTGQTLEWTPTTEGTAQVVVTVSDGQLGTAQSWTLTTGPDVPFTASSQVDPDPVTIDQMFTIDLNATNACGALSVIDATLDGEAISFAPSLTYSGSFASPGERNFSATLTDGCETVSVNDTVRIIDPNDTAPPTVAITAPLPGEQEELLVITAPREVFGTVQDDNLDFWLLALSERGSDSSEFIELARGSDEQVDSNLGELDPTMLQNGQWTLILQAFDLAGNEAFDSVGIAIEGDLKVGHFSITFEDLNIPVAGLPVTVTRTYDTRQRHKNQDFGYGWSVDYENIRVQESRTPGFAWELTQKPAGPLGSLIEFCVESALGNVVSVVLPDGEVEKFRAVATPACNLANPILDVTLSFEPMEADNGGRLEAIDRVSARLINGSLADPGAPTQPIDPSRYRYTTAEGREFILDQGFTIREVYEPEGENTITFGDDGILHSGGLSVTFVRDAQDRITQVLPPDGTQLNYEYNDNGDLIAFIDAQGHRTEFTYLDHPSVGDHYLEDIIDPRGIRVSRNVYDEDGRLVAIIDADGNRIDYIHDVEGRTETVTDRRGTETIYLYNDRGDVLQESQRICGIADSDPANQDPSNCRVETIARTYDLVGNQLTETNAIGETTTWTYDPLGNVLTETNDLGETTTYEYQVFNQLARQIDDAGVVVMENRYSNRIIAGAPVFPGPLNNVKDALGNDTNFAYHTTGEVRLITDAEGNNTLYDYDANGFKTLEEDARGNRTEYVVDSMGRTTEMRQFRVVNGVAETLITTYTHDLNGNVTQMIHPDGSVTRTEYDAAQQVVAQIDALGRRTEFEYDNRGNQTLIRYPDGLNERTVYDPEGNVIEEIDRAGRSTKMVYDQANRLVATIYPDDTPADDTDNPRTRNVYDAADRVTESIDERGNTTRYEYDSAGRQTKVIDALGNETLTTYDNRGRRVSMTDAKGTTTSFSYDDIGRLLVTTHPDGSTMSQTFDKVGRTLSKTDQAGRVTGYEYDGLGNLTAVIQDANNLALRTEFEYDEQGNKTVQRDALGRETIWTFDRLGRTDSRTLPLGQTETMVYDAASQMTESTDFNGNTTTYTYDNLGRETLRTYHDGTSVATSYTNTSLPATVTDHRGVTTYLYDTRDRVTDIGYPQGHSIHYAYDDSGNRTELATANQQVNYTFDALNRLATVTDQTGTTTYHYDVIGLRSRIDHANGTSASYTFDDLNRLTDVVNEDANGTIITEHHYTLSPTGQRMGVSEGQGRQTSYTYDSLDRLTGESVGDPINGNRTASWTYDQVGNRQSQTIDGVTTSYAYDANDRLLTEVTSGSTTTYTFDANGNTLTESGPEGTTTYAWTPDNRLAQATTPTTVASYQYDPAGIRQSQTVDGIETTFLIDPTHTYAQVIEELATNGTAIVLYTHGDELLSQTRTTGTTTYHYDGLGSTRALSDQTGQPSDQYHYQVFGELDASTGATDNNYLYTGEQLDPALGQYYLRARYYDPTTGRFPSMDTYPGRMREPATLHKYLYVHGNPVNGIDPSGLAFLGLQNLGPSIAARLTTLALHYPRTALVLETAASAATPIELAALTPVTATLVGTTALGVSAATKLDDAARLADSSYWLNRIRSGNAFEDFIATVTNLKVNTREVLLNGEIQRTGQRVLGSAVPDFFFRGGILEAKLSASAVKRNQFIQFAKYVRQNGSGNLTYVFYRKPPRDKLDEMVGWLKSEGLDDVSFQAAYILD